MDVGPERSLIGGTTGINGASCARSLRRGLGKGMTDGRDMEDELTRRPPRG